MAYNDDNTLSLETKIVLICSCGNDNPRIFSYHGSGKYEQSVSQISITVPKGGKEAKASPKVQIRLGEISMTEEDTGYPAYLECGKCGAEFPVDRIENLIGAEVNYDDAP